MLLLSLLSNAEAFCGTWVGPVGSELENGSSQVIVARDGERNVLTLANDYQGDASDFGLVIPVPQVLTEADVSLVDATVFDTLNAYTAPRLVTYSCSDFINDTADYASSSSSNGVDAGGVTVESEFSVGQYHIVVLSAKGAEGLGAWLDSHGFAMPAGTEDLLQEYIDADFYFMAAQVGLAELPSGMAFLSPLQLRYDAPAFSLPIRIGTASSTGQQEVILHVLNRDSEGKASISNYDQATVEDECMLPADAADPSAFYDEQMATAFGEGVWIEEYSWGLGWCDPCSAEPPDDATLQSLGVTWDTGSTWITRLRARYTPEQATQDLSLYSSGLQETSQIRYILYDRRLESQFPVCGVGMVENPGTCSDSPDSGDTGDGWVSGTGSDTCGCAANGASGFWLGGLAGLLLVLHRRAQKH